MQKLPFLNFLCKKARKFFCLKIMPLPGKFPGDAHVLVRRAENVSSFLSVGGFAPSGKISAGAHAAICLAL